MNDFNLSEFNKLFLEILNQKSKTPTKYMTIYSHGLCFYYAYVVTQVFENVTAYSYINRKFMNGHCFLKINNKYYDSENPEGVSDYKDLQKFLKRVRTIPTRHEHSIAILKWWGVYTSKAFAFTQFEADNYKLYKEVAEEIKLKLNPQLARAI